MVLCNGSIKIAGQHWSTSFLRPNNLCWKDTHWFPWQPWEMTLGEKQQQKDHFLLSKIRSGFKLVIQWIQSAWQRENQLIILLRSQWPCKAVNAFHFYFYCLWKKKYQNHNSKFTSTTIKVLNILNLKKNKGKGEKNIWCRTVSEIDLTS